MSGERLLALVALIIGIALISISVLAPGPGEWLARLNFLNLGGMFVFGACWTDLAMTRGPLHRRTLGFMLAFGVASMATGGLCSALSIPTKVTHYIDVMVQFVVISGVTLAAGVIVTRRALLRLAARRKPVDPSDQSDP